MTRLVEYADRDALATGLAQAVAADVAAISGPVTLAVPGGTTPAPFLAALTGLVEDWRRVTLLATDERWAPPDHERSNERMIRAALGAADPAFLSYWREGEDAATAAPKLNPVFAPHLPLNLCVMGMGADMHCASLFPGGDGLAAAMDPDCPDAVAAITAPGAPEPRVTLTAPRLSEAGRLRLLITGAEKRAALSEALASGDPLAAPTGAVLRRARDAEVHWAP